MKRFLAVLGSLVSDCPGLENRKSGKATFPKHYSAACVSNAQSRLSQSGSAGAALASAQ